MPDLSPRALLAVAGVAILVLALADIFRTTLTLRGAGPVSRRLARGLWKIYRLMLSKGRALLYGGAAVAVGTVVTWMALLWAGWSLIFLAGPTAVVEATSGEPADVVARIYYAGYTLFTLGLGDYRPQGGLWQILTAIAVGNGFLVISLSAAYLVPLLSAAAQKRALALTIDALGASPGDIVASGWTGEDFGPLREQLVGLAERIALVGQQHRAYPILVSFDGPDARSALSVQIARLDEALMILEHAVAERVRPPSQVLRPARNAIDAYFESVDLSGARPARETPHPASTEALAQAGVPCAAREAYEEAAAGAAARRRIALGIVRESGWTWDAVA